MDYIAMKNKAADFLQKYRYVVLVLVIGVVLMLIPTKEKTAPIEQEAIVQQTQQQSSMTKELSQILGKIEGAGEVEVLLTISSGEQTVYQQDENISVNES